MRKYIFIISIIILAGAALIFYGGWFPVASINGDWLWYRDVAQGVRAIERLQSTSPDLGLPALAGTTTPLTFNQKKIQSGVLEELIREQIVIQGLARLDSSRDWERAVMQEIDTLLQNRNKTTLQQAARELYGLSLHDFETLVLAPQIRDDFLREELARRAEETEAWTESALKSAAVNIYFLDYAWKEGRLVEQ
jgi:hypothetical protein